MQFRDDDDDLFSIGAVAIAEASDEHDTTSDVSDWVLQYTDWEEGAVQFECTPTADFASKVGPVYQAFLPGRAVSLLPRAHFVQTQ